MAGIIEARQRLDSQQSENELVLKVSTARLALVFSPCPQFSQLITQEFAQLKSHNTVYKLIGPSLVPQDANEAKANVEKRLEFITNEMYV
jgi:prefoldin beta subunit